ncbi:MAG: tetratricopeptide repeat protein [Alphaproteobacteria bacterium]|nr:tetratricopeptide repeat protein [Alphaproteobacteria bacterium]
MFSAKIKSLMLCTVCTTLISGCCLFNSQDTTLTPKWLSDLYIKDGNSDASDATVAYSQGDFKKALSLCQESLDDNPKNQQALLVGALASEKLGRYNRARQYYEDLIIIDGTETSILGSKSGSPEKISQIAKQRLRSISIKQSKLVIENNKFDISAEAAKTQNKSTINKALRKKNSSSPSADKLFTADEQNAISRFLVLKEMAENDFISKEEFLSRRNANIGALLPLTKQTPGADVIRPVPSPDLIIERISILKEGVETRAVTPREFAAERELIIEALMQPNPRERLKPKAPSKNILDAAKDIRKLEALYNLNLITSSEKAAEKTAIEKYLGINKEHKAQNQTQLKPSSSTQTDKEVSSSVSSSTAPNIQPAPVGVVEVKTTVEEMPIPLKTKVDTVTQNGESVALITSSQNVASSKPQNLVPAVSSPF